jgi:hypothetical protein
MKLTPRKLETIVHGEPFQPFRLLLANGEEVIVNKPRKAHVSGNQVALHGITRRPDGVAKQGLRIIRADTIVSAGLIDAEK